MAQSCNEYEENFLLGKDYIKQLTVGGFQTFADPIAIPFGPLTLLYGPNSAGKSALLDAMLALADLCEVLAPIDWLRGFKNHRVASILDRHWRRESVMPVILAKKLKLGAVIRIAGEEWAQAGFAHRGEHFYQLSPLKNFETCFRTLRPLWKADGLDLEISLLYGLSSNGDLLIDSQALAQEQRIEVRINGSAILVFDAPARLACLNLDHPALLAWDAAPDLRWMAHRFSDGFVTKSGWFGTRVSAIHDGWLSTNAIDVIEHDLSEDERPRARNAEDSFLCMFDALFRACMRSMSSTLRVPLVPASRAVPTRSELTFLLAADGKQLRGEPLGLRADGLPEHLGITQSAFEAELKRYENSERHPEDPLGLINDAPQEKAPIDLVNRLLREYLFSTSGYFLAAGVHEFTSLRPLRSDEKNVYTDAGRRFLVSLELSDSTGRRFNFDEVGSGLGYVLPVLLAVATSRTVFLQQPELHLHPALQSQLADALIVALGDADFGGKNSRGCHQIIAETHSEHLLLRLLRRVRQAGDPKRSLDPHSLGRESVVVLYVDPNPEGFSTVKHLRISRKGDFIDRWPNGFFEERWTELFDE